MWKRKRCTFESLFCDKYKPLRYADLKWLSCNLSLVQINMIHQIYRIYCILLKFLCKSIDLQVKEQLRVSSYIESGIPKQLFSKSVCSREMNGSVNNKAKGPGKRGAKSASCRAWLYTFIRINCS